MVSFITSPKSCATIILDFVKGEKFRQMNSIVRMAILFGPSFCNWLFQLLDSKWINHPQPPSYFWNIKSLVEKDWKKNYRLLAIKKTPLSTILLPGDKNPHSIESFIKDQELASSNLSIVCNAVFNDARKYKSTSRELDILTYGEALAEKSLEIENEIMKLEQNEIKT